MTRFLKYWPILIIAVVTAFLFLVNTPINRWLIGWDSYTPNLHFGANFERNIFGVWQEDRGLGLLDGMSHVANLLHTTMIWLLSFVTPDYALRSLYHFIQLGLGGIGMYFLARRLFKSNWLGLAAGLFYMLNIGTIQMFYLPLEVFSVHFAALPWLIFLVLRYFEKPSLSRAFWFVVASFFFSPQGYVPTVFAVYGLALVVIVLFQVKTKDFLQKAVVVFFLTLAANAFWAIPYAYSMIKNVPVIGQAKINVLSNEAIRWNNKEFGDLPSTALIQGLYLSFVDQDNPQNIHLIMQPWVDHLHIPLTLALSWGFFVLVLAGLVSAVVQRKKHLVAISLLGVFTFLMLGNNVPGLSLVFDSLTAHVPIFGSAYRFVFTKFSLLYVFCYTLLLVAGLEWLSFQRKVLKIGLALVLTLSVLFTSWPVWQGHFFYQDLQVAIPTEYFQLRDFFNSVDHTQRVAFLPQPELWGWSYNTWGFKGSGFIWQALPQPTMDGAFLPWLPENENYFLELQTAIDGRDLPLIEKILSKYQVQWIVVDKSLKQNGATPNANILGSERAVALLSASDKMKLVKEMGSLAIYKYQLEDAPHSFVFAPAKYDNLAAQKKYTRFDPALATSTNYVSDQHATSYPFQDLTLDRALTDISTQEENGFTSLFVERPLADQENVLSLATIPAHQLTSYPIQVARENGDISIRFLYPFELLQENGQPLFSADLLTIKENVSSSGPVELKVGTYSFEVQPDAHETFFVTLYPEEKIAVSLSNTGHSFFNSDITTRFWTGISSLTQRQFSLPTTEKKVIARVFTSITPTDLEHSTFTYNCDLMKRGETTRKFENGLAVYEAKNRGSLCDNFGFGNLSHALGQIVHLKGKNLQNRSVNFYLHNWITGELDLQDLLPHGNFDQYYALLPQHFVGNKGYSVNLETRSYLNTTSQNEIEKIEIYTFPFEQLLQLTVHPATPTVTAENKVNIHQVQKIGTYLYFIQADIESDKGMIGLSQGFDQGWLAFSLQPTPRVYRHVLFNSWANMWELPPGENTLILLYWPQLLSFAGWAMFFGTLISIAIAKFLRFV